MEENNHSELGLKEEVQALRKDVANLAQLIQKLESIVLHTDSAAHRMDSHIDFVESIYQRVRLPFSYFFNTLGWMYGKLPVLPKRKIAEINSTCQLNLKT